MSTHTGKRLRRNSFGGSLDSLSSRPPTPPPHSTVYLPSPLSGSIDSRSTTSTERTGSVIRKPSRGPQNFHHPYSSSTASTFSTSQTSSIPLDFSHLESTDHSWSPSSSSFQTSSSITLNESSSSKRPRHLDSEGSYRGTYQRDFANNQALVTSHATSPGIQVHTKLPSIPGYGPICVTVNLPPTPSYFPQNATYTPTPIATPNSETTPHILPHSELETALDFLTDAEIRQLLRLAVRKHPNFGIEVRQEYALKSAAERSKVIHFVQYGNNVWHTLNTKYNFLDGEKQHDMASQAVEDVSNDIAAIVREVKRESSLGTKRSAIETLRKIGRSICLATGIIGDKVREWIGYDARFVDALADIVAMLSEEEKREIKDGNDGEVVKRLEQLDELRQYYGVFEKFDEALRGLQGEDIESSGFSGSSC